MVEFRRLLKKLLDLGPGARRMGLLLKAESQGAFVAQSFEGHQWPARYPTSAAPKINYAGALTDLNRGNAPKARRFQDRPALLDTGKGRRSITFNWTAPHLEVGSPLAYMGAHNIGGASAAIPISATARKKLAKLLKKHADPNIHALRKLNKALQGKSVWQQDVLERPFVGLTPGNLGRAVAAFEAWLNG